jgi:hypothetical protein
MAVKSSVTTGDPMSALEREEYIEQAYFFRALRERLEEGQATQTVLESIGEELLSTTRLPMAVSFLAGEVKHSGLLSTGFSRLLHYFTPFQAYVIEGTEDEKKRFEIGLGLLILQREAEYRASGVTPAGLFVYQFEAMSRNRLGYDAGVRAMRGDPYFDADWKAFLTDIISQLGVIDFADLIFLRSQLYVCERRRDDPEYQPPLPPLFGEKEGKIARANSGRDPLYLFASLQRQLGYPEVPRPRPRDDLPSKLEALRVRLRDLEARMRVLEADVKGTLDLSKLVDPEKLKRPDDEW